MSPDFLLAQRPPRPKPGLRLTLSPREGRVPPGGRIRFELRLENRDRVPQDVVLAVEDPEESWTATLPIRTFTLQAGASCLMLLRVDAPPAAQLGERMTFQVSAAGSSRPDRAAVLVVEAVVEG